ncbi:exported hypothetical protein [Frigoribacterium sp. 9N]|nr:exported hypothetical protein [Frigoribacterium sp. 9N]
MRRSSCATCPATHRTCRARSASASSSPFPPRVAVGTLGAAAGVVELADTQDLGSCAFEREGSSPFSRTQSAVTTCPLPPGFTSLLPHR